MTPGFVVAAAASGSGKTILTLGILRAFRNAGVVAGSAKIGPDYIDPRFHEIASGRTCLNLDGWAMRRDRVLALAAVAGDSADILVVEGVMGLFDRSAELGVEGRGGAAEVAKTLGVPVVLVVDGSGMAQSVGALVDGFRRRDAGVHVVGVILNRVASDRHEKLLSEGCDEAGVPVFGAVRRSDELKTPARHLGLVQADELESIETLIESAASAVSRSVDLDVLRTIARPVAVASAKEPMSPAAPLGARIAVAYDVAFRFAYPHVLEGWRASGAKISTFSPLADEAPDMDADAVFLPGGYPELHAGVLSGASTFRRGMTSAAERGAAIYGECGGYMVLGEGLIDADGAEHRMLGLLALETSFAKRRLHLGYRHAMLLTRSPLGEVGVTYRTHEFHYASIVREQGEALFRCRDGSTAGLSRGRVAGSFLHVIDGV